MRDRRSWKDLGKEERALKLQKIANTVASMPVAPATPKEWREIAYDMSVPENVVRAHFDPTQKDYYAKQAAREKKRQATKVPSRRD